MALQKPLPPPPTNPEDTPTVCVEINEQWIKYIIGILWPMKFHNYWGGTLDENRVARRNAQNLIQLFMIAGDCGDFDMNNCECEVTLVVQHRINPITLQIEISIDGGNTWTPDPHGITGAIIEQPPPVTAGTTATVCDAATNGKEHIEDIIAECETQLTAAATIFDLAAAVVALIIDLLLIPIASAAAVALIPSLIAAIYAAAVGIWNLGVSGFSSYWDATARDNVLCALFCNIGSNGAFTDAQYAGFISQFKATLADTPARNMVLNAVLAIGRQGLNNICSYGAAADADCAGCNCNCDFTTWVIVHGTLISRDADHIALTAVEIDGSWVTEIRAPNVNACCKIAQPITTGLGSPVYEWNFRNESYDGDFPLALHHSGIWGSEKNVSAGLVFGFSGSVLDTVTYTSVGDCDS